MQEKKVDENARTNDAHDAAEQPAEHTRDDIAVVVASVRHLQRPDLREHAGEEGPEDDAGFAIAVSDVREEEAAASQASLGCGALRRVRRGTAGQRKNGLSSRLTW